MINLKTFNIFILLFMLVDYLGIFFADNNTKGVLVLSLIIIYIVINVNRIRGKRNVIHLIGMSGVAMVPLASIVYNGIDIDLLVPLGILYMICIRTYVFRFSYSFGLVTGILYSLLRFGVTTNVIVWNLFNRISHFITRPLSFGLASFGESLGLVVPLISIIVAIVIVFRNNFRKLALYIGLILISYVIHLISLAYVLVNFPRSSTTFIPIFLVLVIVFYLLFVKDADEDNMDLDVVIPIKTRCVLYISCIIIALTVSFVPVNIERSTQVRAVIIGGTYSDVVSRPEHVPFPGFSFSNALYGAFSIYLENSGYDVTVAENVESIDFNNTDIVFLIMYNIAVEQGTTDKLRSFVAGGGRLVVVGDHTNIFGSTVVSNPIHRTTTRKVKCFS